MMEYIRLTESGKRGQRDVEHRVGENGNKKI